MRTQGILEVDFVCRPLPPTGWSLVNASGMRHLAALADGDEQGRALPLVYLKIASKDLHFTTRQVTKCIMIALEHDNNRRHNDHGHKIPIRFI